MEGLSMRQNTRWAEAGTIIVDVNLSNEPDTHSIYGRIDVYPLGHPPSRRANAGECIVRLQDRFLGWWRTIEQRDTLPWAAVATPPYDYLANFLIVRSPRLNPGQYRLTAEHKESGAEYGREFTVGSDFTVSNWSARIKVKDGTDMPPTFRQFEKGPARPARGIALPEALRWPAEFTTGYSGSGRSASSGYAGRPTQV